MYIYIYRYRYIDKGIRILYKYNIYTVPYLELRTWETTNFPKPHKIINVKVKHQMIYIVFR